MEYVLAALLLLLLFVVSLAYYQMYKNNLALEKLVQDHVKSSHEDYESYADRINKQYKAMSRTTYRISHSDDISQMYKDVERVQQDARAVLDDARKVVLGSKEHIKSDPPPSAEVKCAVSTCRQPIEFDKADYHLVPARDGNGERVMKYKHRKCQGTLV